jgi:8-oxo-dGTP pyrophosphatase MutT (NUDIX family)
LPAGAIEPGEQPAQAIVREVLEETGLTVRPKTLLGIFGGRDGYRVRYENGDNVEYLVCLFECEIISGDLKCLDGESASLRFYAPDKVPPLGTEYPRVLFIQGIKETSFEWDDQWLRGTAGT